MRKLMVGIIVLTLVIGVGTVGFAYSGYDKQQKVGFNKNFAIHVPIYDPLDLSEKQEEQIKELKKEYAVKGRRVANQLRKKSMELNKLIMADEDIVKITILKEEVSDLQYEMLQLRTTRMQKIVDILTDEQIEQLNKMTLKKYIIKNKAGRGTDKINNKQKMFKNKFMGELGLSETQLEEVKELYEEYGIMKQDMMEELGEDMTEELKDILTDEQFEKLKEIKK